MTTTFMTSDGFARGALGFGPGLGCPVFDLPVGERGQGGEHFAQVAVGIEPAEEEEGTREAGGRAGGRAGAGSFPRCCRGWLRVRLLLRRR